MLPCRIPAPARFYQVCSTGGLCCPNSLTRAPPSPPILILLSSLPLSSSLSSFFRLFFHARLVAHLLRFLIHFLFSFILPLFPISFHPIPIPSASHKSTSAAQSKGTSAHVPPGKIIPPLCHSGHSLITPGTLFPFQLPTQRSFSQRFGGRNLALVHWHLVRTPAVADSARLPPPAMLERSHDRRSDTFVGVFPLLTRWEPSTWGAPGIIFAVL